MSIIGDWDEFIINNPSRVILNSPQYTFAKSYTTLDKINIFCIIGIILGLFLLCFNVTFYLGIFIICITIILTIVIYNIYNTNKVVEEYNQKNNEEN